MENPSANAIIKGCPGQLKIKLIKLKVLKTLNQI